MGTDKQEEEDDGRVIADMSGIETPSLFAPFSRRKKRREGEVPEVKNHRPWEDSSLNQKERFWYAMGRSRRRFSSDLPILPDWRR